MKHSIAILIPYFGKWPSNMNLYLDSCKKNEIFNFIFFTDLGVYTNSPENVKYVHFTFEEIILKIEVSLNIELPSIKPYKLCDYRPAFGLIFSDLLTEYDFWGYGDIDLIYGNLKSIFTKEVLEENDIFALRRDHLHGPLTFYRNDDFINSLFARSEQFVSIFTNPEYSSFDEFGKEGFHVNISKDISEYSNDNISVIALKAQKKGEVALFMKAKSKEVIYKKKEIIVYEKGNVYNKKSNEQYGFYHWVIEKRAVWFEYPKWKEVPNKYFITESGFYTENQFKFYLILKLKRKIKGGTYWLYLKFMNYIKRKIGINVSIDTYPIFGFIKHL